MTANMNALDAGQHHAASSPLVRKVSNLVHAIGRLAGKGLGAVHASITALQTARMLSTLSNMSNEQLAQIGISRSDIPTYAKTLMARAQD